VNLKEFVGFSLILLLACSNAAQSGPASTGQVLAQAEAKMTVPETTKPIQVGAERYDTVRQLLSGKRVGLVVNHTSMSGEMHLVDRLHDDPDIEVARIFGPEHGFRGEASDGEQVKDGKDPATGLEVISLYGKTKRPTAAMFRDLDVVVFDIQDVGVRFYTYISTMHYVMDAAAEYGVEVLVLDRPNPNGQLVDGPLLEPEYRSFIGMHPIPVAHGLTVGELALMINGEGWLENGRQAKLTVVPVANYQVGEEYVLPIAPSPNLPNQASIYLSPTLCFFEGTVMSVGRGTDLPFQMIGHPQYGAGDTSFVPTTRAASKFPKLEGEVCRGQDVRAQGATPPRSIDFELRHEVMEATAVEKFIDRPQHFDRCAGTSKLREVLEGAGDLNAFRAWFEEDLVRYKAMSKHYFLYPRLNASK
jgi:hypothetical protein